MKMDDLGPLPKVNPRDVVFNVAGREMKGFLDDLHLRYQLSMSEFLALILRYLTERADGCVHVERRQAEQHET